MKILFVFILLTFNSLAQQTIYVKSTIDVTIRKAPDPVKPIDWNKESQKIISSINAVGQTIEQKRAFLENLTKEGNKMILAYKSNGYSTSLNNFQNLAQTEILEVIDAFHNSLINGWIKSEDYPGYIEKVVSDYILYVQGIENFNVSLKNKIDAYSNSNDTKKISLISEKLNEIVLNSNLNYTYDINSDKKRDTYSNQVLKINYNNKSLETYAFTAVLSSALDAKDNSYEGLYLEADLLHNKKQYRDSYNTYNKALLIKPSSDSAYCFRARELYYLNDFYHAEIDAHTAIEINEINDCAYYWRASARASQNKYDDAIIDFNKAILLNPKNSLYFFGRADVKKKLNDNKGALDDYNKVLLLNPNDDKAYKYKVLLEEKLKE